MKSFAYCCVELYTPAHWGSFMHSFIALFLVTASQAATYTHLRLAPPPPQLLGKNSKLECRYLSNEVFGLLFERGDGDTVRGSLISSNVNEGDATAFTAEIKVRNQAGVFLFHQSRAGKYGRIYEIEIFSAPDPRIDNKLMGRAMMTSALYTPQPDGTEKEELYPDQSNRMACQSIR